MNRMALATDGGTGPDDTSFEDLCFRRKVTNYLQPPLTGMARLDRERIFKEKRNLYRAIMPFKIPRFYQLSENLSELNIHLICKPTSMNALGPLRKRTY